MKLKAIFQDFYGVKLEIAPDKSIRAKGLEKLPEKIRTDLENWIEKYRDYVLENLKNDK